MMNLASAVFLGNAKTKEKYPLVASSPIPYLFNKAGIGHHVEVELYEVEDTGLEILDRFEGHPNFYVRSSIKFVLENGKELEAYVYFISRKREDFTGIKLEKSF